MNKKRPAALTSSLLADKGKASPTISPAMPGTRAVGGLVASSPAAGRAKLTMRLDRERHFRLKLVAAHLKRSSQEVLTQALDAYLDQLAPAMMNGGCACLEAAGFGQSHAASYQQSSTGHPGASDFGGSTPFASKDPTGR